MITVALPYPVLGRIDDYVDASFQVGIVGPEIQESEDTSIDEVTVGFRFMLSDEAIEKLIKDKKAGFGFEVRCAQTANRYIEFTSQKGEVRLDASSLYGKVELLPRIFVIEAISAFRSENFNDEFGGACFDLVPGDALATADDVIFFLDFKRLAFQQLLSVRKADDMEPWAYDFGLEGNSMVISMGKTAYEIYTLLKPSEQRPLLVMSIHKDCLVAALHQLASNPEDCEELKWANAVLRTLKDLQLELPEANDLSRLNHLAQFLLKDRGINAVATS